MKLIIKAIRNNKYVIFVCRHNTIANVRLASGAYTFNAAVLTEQAVKIKARVFVFDNYELGLCILKFRIAIYSICGRIDSRVTGYFVEDRLVFFKP